MLSELLDVDVVMGRAEDRPDARVVVDGGGDGDGVGMDGIGGAGDGDRLIALLPGVPHAAHIVRAPELIMVHA